MEFIILSAIYFVQFLYCFYFIFSVFSIFSFYPIFRCYLIRLFLQVYLLISDWQRRTLVLRRKSLLLWGVIWCMVGLWQPTLPLDTVHSSICHFSPRAVIMPRTDIPPSSREIAYGGNPFCRAFSLRAQFFSTCFVGGAIICLRFYLFRVLSVASRSVPYQ